MIYFLSAENAKQRKDMHNINRVAPETYLPKSLSPVVSNSFENCCNHHGIVVF